MGRAPVVGHVDLQHGLAVLGRTTVRGELQALARAAGGGRRCWTLSSSEPQRQALARAARPSLGPAGVSTPQAQLPGLRLRRRRAAVRRAADRPLEPARRCCRPRPAPRARGRPQRSRPSSADEHPHVARAAVEQPHEPVTVPVRGPAVVRRRPLHRPASSARSTTPSSRAARRRPPVAHDVGGEQRRPRRRAATTPAARRPAAQPRRSAAPRRRRTPRAGAGR